MKQLKMLGLVAAAVVLTGAVIAGNASATVLCETNTNPCNSPYAEGKDIHKTQTIHSTLTAAFSTTTCTERIKTEDYRTYWFNKVTTNDYTNCNCTVKTLAPGEVEYQHTEGANGVLIEKGFELTSSCAGIACIFGDGSEAINIGKVTGGNPATVSINAKLSYIAGDSSSFLCTGGSGTATLTEGFTITSPKPLYVVES